MRKVGAIYFLSFGGLRISISTARGSLARELLAPLLDFVIAYRSGAHRR